MKETILKNKTLVIIVSALVLAAIGFGAGMMVKTALARDGGNYIGAEKAKRIALENVGVSKARATFTKVELERDDEPAVYDIAFYTASNEYDFEINAKSGEITEKSSKARSGAQPPADPQGAAPGTESGQSAGQPQDAPSANAGNTAPSYDYIGIDRAKRIALNHAGISQSDATFTKTKLDSDDGTKTYEIKFTAGGKEYEYEINAYTGKILDHEKEKIDNHKDDDDEHED